MGGLQADIPVRAACYGGVHRPQWSVQKPSLQEPLPIQFRSVVQGSVPQITSAGQSPRMGGVLALAYVRRGVDQVVLEGRDVTVPDHFPASLEPGSAAGR